MVLPLRWAGAQHSQSPVGAYMRNGDKTSMLFRFAERWSILLTFQKEFESRHRSASLPTAISSSATAEPGSLTSTLPPRSIALTTRLSSGWSSVSNATDDVQMLTFGFPRAYKQNCFDRILAILFFDYCLCRDIGLTGGYPRPHCYVC
jgi:hypothetical protein